MRRCARFVVIVRFKRKIWLYKSLRVSEDYFPRRKRKVCEGDIVAITAPLKHVI